KDRLDVAFSNFFTYAHLSELRTLTLRTVADLMSDKEKVRHNHKTSLKPHIAVAISGSIYNEAVIKGLLKKSRHLFLICCPII
ncbi:hypothetical protein, partial [Staphylococcus aureus]|uniref:hypothetical protein n=1 Tax=Staphylococcus aureus TaxID=1280 RepID=UPI0015D7BE39